MAISKYLFSPTLVIPTEFPTRCVLEKLSLTHSTTHSGDVGKYFDKTLNSNQ